MQKDRGAGEGETLNSTPHIRYATCLILVDTLHPERDPMTCAGSRRADPDGSLSSCLNLQLEGSDRKALGLFLLEVSLARDKPLPALRSV